MKKLIFYSEFGFLSALIWCILYEQINIETVITGFLIGLISVFFANAFLMTRQSSKAYYINPFVFLQFIFSLLFQIFKAAVLLFPSVITGKVDVGIVKIETKVDRGLMTSTIANAITLTPGTVTIDKDGNTLTVLWLTVKSREKEKAGKLIMGSFEKILMKGYKK
ncbi:MAG: Na+/H+ antiporter subunit E [Clostridia bacterium]|nr:Na+/H+ antiporter subunit E [Clostridia bacterium]